jgi:hypothetical protein
VDPKHPTNRLWELFDPEAHPPPRGASLLLINEGGSLIIGQWYEGALAWGFKPVIPATVKARRTKEQQELRERNHASDKPKGGDVDPHLPDVGRDAVEV